MKKVLVTAGATITMIDKVRGITNIFQGKTGSGIADYFSQKGSEVTLITSNSAIAPSNVRVVKYKTYNELFWAMEKEITEGEYDIIIHSSAVSDYEIETIYGVPKGHLVRDTSSWIEIDRSKKIPSSLFEELIIVTSLTEKIVDKIRKPWGFQGDLVKFKLQVGISDEELIKIAKKSRVDSDAEMIIANCLEWSGQYAYMIDDSESPKRVSREEIAEEIFKRIQK
ncbi:phosphopantothenoylcysteine decarboxylase [Patescibacteria group bacterium]